MISRIEAFKYRCFERLDIEMGNFHVFAGANGTGKSTLLDIPILIGDIISNGISEAFLEVESPFGGTRAQTFRELVYQYRGEYFGFAVEADLPEYIVMELLEHRPGNVKEKEERWPRRIRYEIGFEIFNEVELQVSQEYLYIIPQNAKQPEIGWGIRDIDISQEMPDGFQVIRREYGDEVEVNVEFRRKSNKTTFSLSLHPSQIALANIPQDSNLFPAAVWLRRMLERRLVIYEPDPDALRMAIAAGQPQIVRSNASNLPWLVLNLKQSNPEFFKAWVDHVKLALPNIENIDALEREEDRHAYIKLAYSGGYEITSSGLSNGTLRILAMTILPYLANPPALICLEEPENGIHPRGIEVMLESLSSMYESQVWISTHSPIVIAHSDLKNIIVMRNKEDGSSEAIPGDQHPKLRDWKGGVDLGTLFAAGVLG